MTTACFTLLAYSCYCAFRLSRSTNYFRQFFDPDAPTVQHIHNPVEDGEIVVCGYFQGEILFHGLVIGH